MTTLQQKLSALDAEQRARLESMLKQRSQPRTASRPGDYVQYAADAAYPLSLPQQRLWIMAQLDDTDAYNIPGAFRLRGAFDEHAFRIALTRVAQRHEALRTVFFCDAAGEAYQRVLPQAMPDYASQKLSGASDDTIELAMRAVVNLPFDLKRAPPWRVRILERNPRERVLVCSFHHIVFDGWSLGVFMRELIDSYVALLGEPSDEPKPLPIQYRHYVAWQKAVSTPEALAKDIAFWRETLRGELPILNLPADRSRPGRQTFHGALHKQLMPRALFDRLCTLARSEQTTPYAVFLTVLKTLLYRYTGQTDVVVGTPVSGRDEEEIEPLIGVFVNTLPIRSTFSDGSSFRELLRSVRDNSLAAFSHQGLSFDGIVEAVNPQRHAGFNPIFQVLYTYQNAVPSRSHAGLSLDYLDVDSGTAKFDLSLDVFEGVDGPTCLFEYNTDLFDTARIRRMAEHFCRLAWSVADDPDCAVSHLSLLTPEEEDQVFASVLQPTLPLPFSHFVDLFETRVADAPTAIAVQEGSNALSYGELNRRANRLAHALIEAGAVAGDCVGICLPRGMDLIVAVLGVMKSGAAFVALDPLYPIERLRYIAEDAEPVAVVCSTEQQSIAAALEHPLVFIDEALQAKRPEANPNLPRSADAAAYLVYTSGTTGKPKGVRVLHRNYLNSYFGWESVYALRLIRSHLQMASFPFDVFCGDLARALGSGARLLICPQAYFAEPDRLYALMRDEAIECAEFVPAVFRTLAEYLELSGKRLDFMRILVVASDSWYVEEYQAYKALCGPQTRLINSYGMAEAAIDSTWYEGDAGQLETGRHVPIGRPFPNVEILVLDAQLQPVPLGVAGEICVGGLGVAAGYINRPELNAEKFIAHPFASTKGDTLYRTGDLGRWLPDGNVELLGRRDNQVKLRGMRVELGEIDAVLRTVPAVREALTLIREDAPGDKRLVAYLVPAAGVELPPHNELDAHLSKSLPGYMIPTAYVTLAELPVSANGKIDRKNLPAPDSGQEDIARGFVSPRTLSEELLATVWCQVFNLNRVGVHDSFFSLGGHSLLAFQIVSRARDVFKVDLSLQTLFSHPTIAGLASAISELQGRRQDYDATVNALPVIVPDPEHRHEPFPMTEVQQAYWLGRNEIFEFGNVTTHSYDEMETFAVDVARFQKAWNRVVQRHDMLRAVILPDGLQTILTDVPEYPIRVLDLRGRTEAEKQAGIDAVRAEMSHQMLDVHRWPVFDVRITHLDAQRSRIHFSSDALVFDVWSFVIIIEDLVKLYLDDQVQLPALELSFRDYVLAEEQLRGTERYRRALAYWRQRVANLAPAPQLPYARDPSTLAKPHFTRLHAEMEPDTWSRLKLKAVRAGMTATGLMLAAYAEVLAAYSRDPAFSLNLTFLNRHPMHPQVNDIVGEFTSLTLLSVDQSSAATFVERARRVQSDLWNDLEHHDISGVQVLRDLTRAQGGATRAKMPVVFTSALVVPIPKRKEEFPVVPVYRDGVTQTSQVWLDCGVWEDDHVLLCNWDVVLELFPDGLIEEMFDAYWRLVHRLADDEAAWQQDILDVLPKRAEPAGFTQPKLAPLPLGAATLADLFREQLFSQPDAIACIDAEGSFTYRQLAAHAAYVAREIMASGLGQRDLIAVALEKGWRQAAAVLGIVATGAAYMPIDPSLPDERIRLLLDEAIAPMLITQPTLAIRMAELAASRTLCVLDRESDDPELLQTPAPPHADDLAYVIFTSGSTGKPKGVMINHRGAVNTVLDLNDRLDIGLGDRLLALSSLSFDLSVYDIFGALAAGAAVVFPDHQRRLDPTHWASLIDRYQVSVWNSVPALGALLADYAEQAGVRLPSLRHVLFSGDWIPVNLAERMRRIGDAVEIHGLGGATEASIWSVIYPITYVPPSWSSIPYGQALRNQSIHVLNRRLEPCPDWVTGELYIGGIGLARGYWHDTEKTNAAFITHPRSGERLYRTGDLGRRLPDGNIEFLGRKDFQVKVQGHRIELGEIESVLLKDPAIKDAVVHAFGDARGDKRLGAYVVARPGATLDLDALKDALKACLPDYMVPQAIHALDALPLTANGKIDRHALPPLFTITAQHERRRVDPRTPAEAEIAAVWRSVLNCDAIGVEDDFFEIGGDSMLAIKLLAQLRHGLKRDFKLRDIFVATRIAAQAGRLEELDLLQND